MYGLPPPQPQNQPEKEITAATLLKVFGIGAAAVVVATTVGYFWTGGKSGEEIQENRRVEKEKARERAQQMRQLTQQQRTRQELSKFAEGNQLANFNGDPQHPKMRELQQLLMMVMTSAEEQMGKGAYDKAAEFFNEALQIIPPNIPQYDSLAMDILPKLVTCYLELNRAEDAETALNSIRPKLSENPETFLSFNFIKVQVLDYLNKDAQLEVLLLDNIKSARNLYGVSAKYISQLYAYAMFLVKKKKYEEAIAKFQECLDFHGTSGAPPSQEEFGIYRQIERCYLYLGDLEEALKVLEKVKLTTEDPISYGWQLHHLAGILFETGFLKEGEQFLRDLLEEYPIPPGGEFESPRIKSLVSNTLSELAMHLYNNGNTVEANNYFKTIEANRWGVLSSSIYLEAKSANIYFSPKPDQAIGFSARINCEFSLSKKIEPGMLIEFDTETTEGKQTSTVIIEKGQISVKFKGNEVTKIQNRVYPVVAKIYKDSSKKQLIFTHYQFVPSSIDTTNMKTWSDIETGFKNRQGKA